MIASAQTRANRRAAGRKAAEAKKVRAALRDPHAPTLGPWPRGVERGDYTVAELLARIRAAGIGGEGAK